MPQVYGVVQQLIPSLGADASQKQVRTDKYGAQHSIGELMAWAQEGNYFKACNATMGTGVAHAIQTTFSDTANVLFIMRNGSSTRHVIPHYIRLVNTAAGASTTSSHLAVITDTANRYSSGGTDLTTNIVCANSGQAPASIVDVLRYNATGAAASAKRQCCRAALKTATAPCWLIGDQVLINFASRDMPSAMQGLTAVGTMPGVFVVNAGPLVLGGQNHCLLIHQWNVANASTAPSWEFELAWWER